MFRLNDPDSYVFICSDHVGGCDGDTGDKIHIDIQVFAAVREQPVDPI